MKHIVIDARSRPSGSGSGRYVEQLLQHLQALDKTDRYTVLLRPGDEWNPSADNFHAIPCPYKQFSFNLLNQISFALFLYRLKPDLVHFTMTPQEPLLYFGKRVTTTHDLTMFGFTRAGRLPGWLHAARMAGYQLLFWWSLRIAGHILVPSRFVADDVSRRYNFAKDKITVTYEASEPPIPGKSATPDFWSKVEGRKSKVGYLLNVGSPFPHKNVERLVDAFALVKKDHPELRLVLAGKKEQYFEKLEAYARKSPVQDSIVFPGFVSGAELKWLYQNAGAYVLPSLSEGFGLPGLEAMTYGCPVISSKATCLPEIYGDGALYFDPLNTEDMAEKIHDVLSDESLRKSLIKNGEKQLKKYSWKRMAEQTLKVYRQVLKD